jgi:hypothetical protein
MGLKWMSRPEGRKRCVGIHPEVSRLADPRHETARLPSRQVSIAVPEHGTRCSDKYWSVKPLLSSREDRLRRARRIDITRPKNGVPHQVSGHSQRSAAGLQVFDQDLDFERIRAEEDTNYLWTLLLDLAYHS